jgi:hypothetical protein
MNIVTTQYLAKPIEEELFDLIQGFQIKTGIRKFSILLGPNEYLSLCHAMTKREKYLAPTSGIIYITSFWGFDVKVKTKPGIDIEIAPEYVYRFAIGEVK